MFFMPEYPNISKMIHLLLLLTLTITVRSSSGCNQSCGGGGASQKHVPYPFGFSESCEIRLNCTNGGIQIGEFQVNVTSDSILVNIPAKCNRSIEYLKPLFHQNYALTWQNGLLLQNCRTQPKGCVIPKALIESQFMFSKDCDPTYCYSKENRSGDFMDLADVEESTCGYLYSAMTVAETNTLSLEFETAQLGWWLEGECNCSTNANCTTVGSTVNQTSRFRCQCLHGFQGDGFMAGNGCRKDNCSPWKYLTGDCGGSARIVVVVGDNCSPSKYLTGDCGGTARIAVLVGGRQPGELIPGVQQQQPQQ